MLYTDFLRFFFLINRRSQWCPSPVMHSQVPSTISASFGMSCCYTRVCVCVVNNMDIPHVCITSWSYNLILYYTLCVFRRLCVPDERQQAYSRGPAAAPVLSPLVPCQQRQTGHLPHWETLEKWKVSSFIMFWTFLMQYISTNSMKVMSYSQWECGGRLHFWRFMWFAQNGQIKNEPSSESSSADGKTLRWSHEKGQQRKSRPVWADRKAQ